MEVHRRHHDLRVAPRSRSWAVDRAVRRRGTRSRVERGGQRARLGRAGDLRRDRRRDGSAWRGAGVVRPRARAHAGTSRVAGEALHLPGRHVARGPLSARAVLQPARRPAAVRRPEPREPRLDGPLRGSGRDRPAARWGADLPRRGDVRDDGDPARHSACLAPLRASGSRAPPPLSVVEPGAGAAPVQLQQLPDRDGAEDRVHDRRRGGRDRAGVASDDAVRRSGDPVRDRLRYRHRRPDPAVPGVRRVRRLG